MSIHIPSHAFSHAFSLQPVFRIQVGTVWIQGTEGSVHALEKAQKRIDDILARDGNRETPTAAAQRKVDSVISKKSRLALRVRVFEKLQDSTGPELENFPFTRLRMPEGRELIVAVPAFLLAERLQQAQENLPSAIVVPKQKSRRQRFPGL